jgi:hypothetical protein
MNAMAPMMPGQNLAASDPEADKRTGSNVFR